MLDVTVRTLTDDELIPGALLVSSVMLGDSTEEVAGAWTQYFELERTHGAFLDDGRPAGIVRWFTSDVALPGGGSAPAALVSAVAVSPAHRRQGVLTRMMHVQLDSIAEEERPLALLIAAEWPIYGRYGYGPAIDACSWKVDALLARFRDAPTGSIEELRMPELRPHLEAMHDLRWARTPGAVTREGSVWDRLSGLHAWPGETHEPGRWRGAIWRDGNGTVQGAVSFKVKEGWEDNRPRGTAEIVMLVGATPEAERELWRHVCSLDWISTVVADGRPVDEPLRLLLTDGRAAVQKDRFDNIWSRVIDVPGTFTPYRAPAERQAVVEVVDGLGYATGRWSLTIGPDGADVSTTTATADVRLPVDALGAIHLGGTPVASLEQAGWLDEERAGGIERVARLFATPTAPWSPTHY